MDSHRTKRGVTACSMRHTESGRIHPIAAPKHAKDTRRGHPAQPLATPRGRTRAARIL